MPPPAPTPQAVFWGSCLAILLFVTLGSMVSAWAWAIGRFRAGEPLLPEPKPRAVPWKTGTVLLVFFAWLAVNFGVSLAYFKLSGIGREHRMPTPTEQMVMVSLVNIVLLVVIPAFLRLTARATLADLGFGRRGLSSQVLTGVLGFLLFSPLVYALNGLAVLVWRQNKHPLEQMVVGEPTVGIACLGFLSAVVLAPAAEELIFRGIIQNWLTQLFRQPEVEETFDLASDLDPLPTEFAAETATATPAAAPTSSSLGGEGPQPGNTASWESPDASCDLPAWSGRGVPAGRKRHRSHAPIVITSAVFAAVHLPQWPAPLAIFFLSVGLGAVYQRSGSLIASFVMHALFNGFGTLMLFLAILAGHPADPKVAPTATCTENAGDIPRVKLPTLLRQPLRRPENRNSRGFSIGAGPLCR